MELGLGDKAAVVLASTAGLGLAVAEALLAEGARVALSGRDPGRLGRELARLDALHPGRVFGENIDVEDGDALEDYLRRVRDQFGAVDILVTNGGGPPPVSAESVSEAELDKAYLSTLKSAINAVRVVVPWMRAQRFGRIVALTSSSVRQPVAGLVLSNTMRAGLTGYMKTLAGEVAAYDVLVNTVCTGMFATDRLAELIVARAKRSGRSVEAERAALVADIPVGRIGDPAEFGAFVAFLCSPRNSFITGSALPIDGGANRGLL